MEIVGWVLTVLGVAFIIVGLIGAYKDVRQKRARDRNRNVPTGFWDELFKILPALLEQLFKAPKWILSCLIGLVLIYFGMRLIGGQPLLPGS